MQSEKKEVGGWWVWILVLVVMTIIALSVLKTFGIIGGTIVERVVFEQSFQYKEGIAQRRATLEANMAEIDMLIATGQGDPKKLNAQKSVLRVQLNATPK